MLSLNFGAGAFVFITYCQFENISIVKLPLSRQLRQQQSIIFHKSYVLFWRTWFRCSEREIDLPRHYYFLIFCDLALQHRTVSPALQLLDIQASFWVNTLCFPLSKYLCNPLLLVLVLMVRVATPYYEPCNCLTSRQEVIWFNTLLLASYV